MLEPTGCAVKNSLLRRAISVYANVYVRLMKPFGIKPRGFGVLLRRIQKEDVIVIGDYKFHINPEVADSYGILMAGYLTEIETHLFLQRIIGHFPEAVFINGGCNIGEFIVAVGSNEGVKRVIGYDIHNECIEACRRSIELNDIESRCDVYYKALGSKAGTAAVSMGHSPQGTNLFNPSGLSSQTVDVTTLDREMRAGVFEYGQSMYVLLLDVEGYEHEILKGGTDFIRETNPIIIFEHNDVSRQHYDLDQVRNTLGRQYQIYRLNRQGYLDQNFVNTWNCVAIPRAGTKSVEALMEASIQP